jgi:hypothetical protein
MRVGYNPKGGKIKSDAGFTVDRAFLAHFNIAAADAVAVSDTGIHAAVMLGDAVQDVATGITNPVVPRNISVKGNASGIAGNVVITGTNYAGKEITETIALNGATAAEGALAFKTVTNVNLPIKTNASGDTVSIGWGKKFGLPYMLPAAALAIVKLFNGSVDSGTVTADVDELEKNIFALNGTPDGAKAIDLYLIV